VLGQLLRIVPQLGLERRVFLGAGAAAASTVSKGKA